MSAVWSASRAAVKRRRLQTTIIGVVVLLSTATITIALALMAAAAAPFDDAFARQSGAHVVAVFDGSGVTDGQLARTAGSPGVQAAAGPFAEAVVNVPEGVRGFVAGPLTVVGRPAPDGRVDRVDLWAGRWPAGPGEIVLNSGPANGASFAPDRTVPLPDGSVLRVVGFASSVSQSAGGWVTPEQAAALHPTAVQMLYRFTAAGTDAEVRAGLAAVTADLPAGALTGSQSYLDLRRSVATRTGAYVPFLMTFGVLGLVVAVLIVVNVVGGAVVSGFRHIGVLKAVGFTPNQVAAVYVLMVSVPAVLGCLLGTLLGDLLAGPLLAGAFQGLGIRGTGVDHRVDAVALLGMPLVVALAALGPALRAHRLSAAEAISAGSAPRAGRALGVQRRLGSLRLPRAVSLGLGQPFARPARTALTTAAIVLGVTAVTLASGLTGTMTAYSDAEEHNGTYQVEVSVDRPDRPGGAVPALGDGAAESLLRSLGAVQVTAVGWQNVKLAGSAQSLSGQFLRGDSASLHYAVVKGHWLDGPGQVVVSGGFLRQRGLAVGDPVHLDLGERRTTVTIVGQLMSYDPDGVLSNWETLQRLAPEQRAGDYLVQLAPGADAGAFAAAFRTAAGPGFRAQEHPDELNQGTLTVVGFASLFTAMLAVVAALGVFNTVVLTTLERRRSLGMLKSIGMTPRQVTVMTVTSMAALGAVGGAIGLPLGILAHRLVVPAAGRAARIDFPASMLHVWHAPLLVLLPFSGLLIAVLGAYVPARSAARLTIAQVLRYE
ncbi:ABC transporter permease [Kitasatospora sp. YST-16]|uniref:ABC transporter permease n=1 Tax=Kitasatospora sp. YST-16 TaxID=2998080 RepID=UPI002284AC51|nr:ABC transporter permease [Kitasatospora sp. YST-16]WAL71657.1 ABC transporter permease [Kitasatospora sp. YST-16]WNW37697.1 ABC transporter permease [Streptomyces sp. Li-HN-5-13]